MSGRFRLGSWLVDPGLNTIVRNGTAVELEPKVMEVLVCLVRHGDETLTKDTLLQEVWPDAFVTDDALKRCILELRRAFDDDARSPHVIQTVAKRGYRLLLPVEPLNGHYEDLLAFPISLNKRRPWISLKLWAGPLALVLILLTTLTIGGFRHALHQANEAAPVNVRPVSRAFDAYLEGNYHLSLYGEGLGQEEQKKAAEYFQHAIDADPNFEPAYLGLANAHKELLVGSSEDVAIRKKSLEKAVTLDPGDSDARAWLGFLKWQPFLDWQGAESEFRRAIAIKANNADAHDLLGLLLITSGRVNEGLHENQIAQHLDPNQDHTSFALYLAHDYDGSIAMLEKMLQRQRVPEPDQPSAAMDHTFLFANFAKKGMESQAIDELAKSYSLFGRPEIADKIRNTFSISGYKASVRQWAKQVEHLQATGQVYSPGTLASSYAILGDKDRAFYWLEQAYTNRERVSFDNGIFFLGADPLYDPLRSDPRFKDLMHRVGLGQ